MFCIISIVPVNDCQCAIVPPPDFEKKWLVLNDSIKKIKDGNNHQYLSIKSILNNKNTIIISPTGSGKTEAFAIPVIQKIINYKKENNNQTQITALFIYPTKSLTRDQLPKINKLTKTNIT